MTTDLQAETVDAAESAAAGDLAGKREFDVAFGLALAVFLGLTGVSCLASLVVYATSAAGR